MPPQMRGLFRILNKSSSKEEDTLSRRFLGAELEPLIETTSFLAFDQEHLWRTATLQNEPIKRPTPETTKTWTSYNTAPELSEPVEHLFDTLLRQERTLEQEDTEILTIKPEMSTDANRGGGGPSVNPFVQAQPLAEEATNTMGPMGPDLTYESKISYLKGTNSGWMDLI